MRVAPCPGCEVNFAFLPKQEADSKDLKFFVSYASHYFAKTIQMDNRDKVSNL